jgi:hypothetical protein
VFRSPHTRHSHAGERKQSQSVDHLSSRSCALADHPTQESPESAIKEVWPDDRYL